jgi:HlyD family secretion protein
MRAFRIIALVALCLGATGLVGQWYFMPAQVEQYVVRLKPLTREITGPGLLGANNQVVVTARVQGFLSAIAVERNDHVEKGQVIARLNASELVHEVAAAEATARAAVEAVREVEINRERSEIALRRAKQDFDRRKALVDNKSISQAEFDATETALRQAEADLSRATVMIERARAEAATAAANLEVLRARYAETEIRAPISGVVISRSRSVGDLLSPGAELMEIVDPDSVVVFARFDESTIDAVHPGDPAGVRFASGPDASHAAAVTRIGRQVDEETREYTVDVKLDELPQTWAIGQRANVTVRSQSAEPGLAVPQAMIVRQDGRAGVWTVRDGRAVWVPVGVGYATGEEVAITSGLEPGAVVLDPEGRYRHQPIAAPAGP